MVVTVISPLLKSPSYHIGSQFVTRNRFGFTFLRYQYTLSIPKILSLNYKYKNKNIYKRGINGLKRTTCTLQGFKYNPQLDIIKFQNRKKKKIFKYSSMPHVENITGLNPNELNIQILLNGYKPLPFITKKDLNIIKYTSNGSRNTTTTATNNNNNNTTMLEISLDLSNVLSGISYYKNRNIWMNSATGIESYDEWKNIPLDIISKLKPFVPPCKLQNGQKRNNNDNTMLDNLDIHKIDPHGLLKQLCDVLYKVYKQGKK